MTDEAMSPLRRRMIEDMTIRKLAPKTQQGYIRTIKNFAVFLGRSPDTASLEDVRRFQLHLAEKGADTPTVNHTVSALRFFFRVPSPLKPGPGAAQLKPKVRKTLDTSFRAASPAQLCERFCTSSIWGWVLA